MDSGISEVLLQPQRGGEPACRAGMRDAASRGAPLQRNTRRGPIPAKETLNLGYLHPSKIIRRLFLLPSSPPPPRQVRASETGSGWSRGDTRTQGWLWPRERLAPRAPKSCRAGGRRIQKSTLNIITRLRFGSASRPVTPPSPSSPRWADGRDARAGGGAPTPAFFR